jgi:hypothetical protein
MRFTAAAAVEALADRLRRSPPDLIVASAPDAHLRAPPLGDWIAAHYRPVDTFPAQEDGRERVVLVRN